MIELDSRLNLIYNPSKGLISALNHGIKIAKGDYIARMDADDISLPKELSFRSSICIIMNLMSVVPITIL